MVAINRVLTRQHRVVIAIQPHLIGSCRMAKVHRIATQRRDDGISLQHVATRARFTENRMVLSI